MGVCGILSWARTRRATIAPLVVVLAVSCFVSAAAAAAPNTRITSGPSGLITTRSAAFRFAATGGSARFECKLDAGAWAQCSSPKSYKRLAQGAHTFRVRALKNRRRDPSPATRSFTVDSVKPNTTILTAPTGVIADHNPSFTFSASEPGTLECKLTTAGFMPCSSPFTSTSPLPDKSYVFQVRARDLAGNVDATPATRSFSVNTPISMDLATAQEAAKLYFPDTLDLDVLAQCGGSPTVDCPGGVPAPATPQLRIASTRSVVAVAGANRYDVTVTQSVQTLAPINVNIPLVGDCPLTMASAPGTTATWNVYVSLNFVIDATFGDLRIARGDAILTGLESADFSITGPGSNLACAIISWGVSGPMNVYLSALGGYFDQVGWKLCAAPGPAYLGPCPPPPGG